MSPLRLGRVLRTALANAPTGRPSLRTNFSATSGITSCQAQAHVIAKMTTLVSSSLQSRTVTPPHSGPRPLKPQTILLDQRPPVGSEWLWTEPDKGKEGE